MPVYSLARSWVWLVDSMASTLTNNCCQVNISQYAGAYYVGSVYFLFTLQISWLLGKSRVSPLR